MITIGTNSNNSKYDVICELVISSYDANKGCVKNINFDVLEECIDCKGSGSLDFTSIVCDKCQGSCNIITKKFSIFGSTITESICDKCDGRGKLITNPCKTCEGYGTIRRTKYLSLKVPKGTRNEQVIKKLGFGCKSALTGQNGDLIVNIKTK